ncbi:MAG: acetyl-CoA carboxylase biotin carboxylase subunit [Rhodocyclaceae bacterium]|nr:acetyl-CoA carboxylase biotin carboxylase subunit [Rhodocyclaceae bacterium]
MNTSLDKATPFSKILIVNRGEIALRIIRSARKLGYRTVAVHSTVDMDERHVLEADQAVCIGEAAPSASYLNIPAILQAAALSGADAVHPGYGFLAENEDFATACAQAGLVFIGPSPQSIISMGNKAGAKNIMLAAGVPCIPGYQGDDQSDECMLAEAIRIGFPVMIKATAGGGGRGMRLVNAVENFPELLRSARSEAQNAFGDAHVILERAIEQPRHIEIQVLADRYSNAIHLGERDCSVQRRHQKLIEESPSPAIDAATRQAMGDTAVAAVKAIGYEGAGTLEFLLDDAGNFYFMEMNTRLQVEHPVTELVTGLDLVEEQIRIAAGEHLSLSQSELRVTGHAIEIRLCAEDPDQDFMPQSGVMHLWSMPSGLRVEEALRPGAVVSPFYDSMIAKIISHGNTREEARRKLMSGLESAVAVGVKTNQRFLLNCLAHPVFAEGQATTAFVASHLGELNAADQPDQDRLTALGAALLSQSSNAGLAVLSPTNALHCRPALIILERQGQMLQAMVEPQGAGIYLVRLGELSLQVQLHELANQSVRFTCGGLSESAAYLHQRNELQLQCRGRLLRLLDRTHVAANAHKDKTGDDKLRAAMSGRIVAVMVEIGQTVSIGQPVMTIEAMKMEHVHLAPISGKVIALHTRAGEHVSSRILLAEFESDPIAQAAG